MIFINTHHRFDATHLWQPYWRLLREFLNVTYSLSVSRSDAADKETIISSLFKVNLLFKQNFVSTLAWQPEVSGLTRLPGSQRTGPEPEPGITATLVIVSITSHLCCVIKL